MSRVPLTANPFHGKGVVSLYIQDQYRCAGGDGVQGSCTSARILCHETMHASHGAKWNGGPATPIGQADHGARSPRRWFSASNACRTVIGRGVHSPSGSLSWHEERSTEYNTKTLNARVNSQSQPVCAEALAVCLQTGRNAKHQAWYVSHSRPLMFYTFHASGWLHPDSLSPPSRSSHNTSKGLC